ncbi:MAG: D-inositol-3-phosphate glycosyltransferase [Mycobacteriales bacterium]
MAEATLTSGGFLAPEHMYATLHTSMGDIEVQLFPGRMVVARRVERGGVGAMSPFVGAVNPFADPLPPFGRPGRQVVRRVATLSVHTSPLDQPGTGDAGGMNVYIVEVSKRLAACGIEVEIFTRATSSDLPPVVEMAPGVTVRHVVAGPLEGLGKNDLPAQLCAFTSGVLRAEAAREPGHYDVIHSHYWLSGQVGWLAKERWGVPLVHSAHTLAKVKNANLADGDEPEPRARVIGEEQVVSAADRLLASTTDEARQLVELYGADPAAVVTVAPGVDLRRFHPGVEGARPRDEGAGQRVARAALGIPADALMLLFVGRIQPLKGPDVLLGAVAGLLEQDPALRDRLVVAVVGGPSGSGLAEPNHLHRLAEGLGIADVLRFEQATDQDQLADFYRAATVVVVPSHSESFGLVAVEAQACGTPVIAAAVGGLRTAVDDGVSGLLVDGHEPAAYAEAIGGLLRDPLRYESLRSGARRHASRFGWSVTTAGVLETYCEAVLAMRRPDAVAAMAAVGGSRPLTRR